MGLDKFMDNLIWIIIALLLLGGLYLAFTKMGIL